MESIDTLVDALSPNNDSIQSDDDPVGVGQLRSLEKLRKLAKKNDETRIAIAESGCVQLIRDLLTNSGNEKVKEKSVILLVYLGKTNSNRQLIRETGALDALLRELDSNNKNILHNTMAALVNICIMNSENQDYIRSHNGIEKVMKLTQSENSKSAQNACWLLKKLVTNNPKNKEYVRDLNLFELVIPLIATSDFPSVQEHAAALLAFMLEKNNKSKAAFKIVPDSTKILLAVHAAVKGDGSKTEDHICKCVSYLGGIKKLERFKPSPSSSGGTGGAGKSPRGPKSPRRGVKSPRVDTKSVKSNTPNITPKNPPVQTRKKGFSFLKKGSSKSEQIMKAQPAKTTEGGGIWTQTEMEDPILAASNSRRSYGSSDDEQVW